MKLALVLLLAVRTYSIALVCFYVAVGGIIFDAGLLVLIGGFNGMGRDKWYFWIIALIIGLACAVGGYIVIGHGIALT